jgi:hypothetical protein
MRILVLAILAVGAVSVAAPAGAQTYDPNYPVCLHVYGSGQLLRMPLRIAGTVRRVGIGPPRTVHRQSIFRECV